MDTGKLIIVGAIGFGVYKYWDQIKQAVSASTPWNEIPVTAQPGPANTNNPIPVVITNKPDPNTQPTQPSPNQARVDLYNKLLQYVYIDNPGFFAASGSPIPNMATYDQWNWALIQVGSDNGKGFDYVFPGANREDYYTIDQFWNGIVNAGLAGGRGLSGGGLGMIFDTVDFLSYYDSNRMMINGNSWI